MKALANYLLGFQAFRDALVSLGWKPPGPSTNDSPNPTTPDK